MDTVWQSFKLWTKLILVAAVLLYVLLFVYNNSGQPVQFWWWFNRTPETSVFFLTAGAFLTGVVMTLLIRTLWKTFRQIRRSQDRSRTDRLEREMAEMRSKAAKLQTRPDFDASSNRI
jgi:lysylphosphatidylglycerol synthetase-like protein (DUF2156 family)